MATKHSGKKSITAGKAAKPSAAKTVQVADVAALLGIEVKEALGAAEVQKLRKALPGYAAHLDDAAELLRGESTLQQILGVSPQELLATHAEQKALLAKESIAKAVYESIYYQRLQVDDRGMEMLQKLGRKLQALGEDDPALLTRWKGLLDYLGTFRPGPRGKKKSDEKPPGSSEPPAE